MTYASRYKSPQRRSGVFISYARSDGEDFAHRLRERLEKQKVRLWQDRVGMEGGRDWWSQISEALGNVAFMTLVATPNALKSEIVRKEWRYARQQGVCVYPIKGAPDLNFNSLPPSSVSGCAFSPDGKLIVSASDDRTLKVWDAQTGQTLATLFAEGQMLCCVIHGEMIVAGGARGVYFLRLVR